MRFAKTKNKDCSSLRFSEMLPVLEKAKNEKNEAVLIVKCGNFERSH